MALRTTANQANQQEQPIVSTADRAWWARGDAPVRTAKMLAPLVDGRAAMLAMCVAFLTAKRSIWLANWDMHARLQMVRGRDKRAGKDGTPEQYDLRNRLRAAGLDDEALALWESGGLRVMEVLGFAARRGVDVNVLLWDPVHLGGLMHIINNPDEQRRLLEQRGVHCRLDKSSRSMFHVAQALHQKCAVVDSENAFIGGVDLTVEYNGDFDRWDTPSHPFDADTRSTDLGPAPHPWHDVHLWIQGAPAADVERNIRQRWEEMARPWYRRFTPPLAHLTRHVASGQFETGRQGIAREERGALPEGVDAEGPILGPQARVQVVRTIPALTYRFAPQGIHGIAQAYTLAVRRARTFIYLESQYLWLENYWGLDILRLGWQSRYMRDLLTEIAAAAERGVTVAVVLPDHPNCGRGYTDGGIAWLRQHAPQATAENRLHFFTLATCYPGTDDQRTRYRPVYVHAKVGVVDDIWATAGSANLNSRGMSHDAELNLAMLDSEVPRALRMALWAEHTGALRHAHTGWPAPGAIPLPAPLAMPPKEGLGALLVPTSKGQSSELAADTPHTLTHASSDIARLEDPCAGIALLAQRAAENVERLRRGDPLVGQLLPYLTHEDGVKRGLPVDHECGILDPLREKNEGITIRHANRYT